MADKTDSQLLRDYAENRSETAFAELARRHVDFVYSAAQRMVCDPHLAEDVSQAVFVALAKDAAQLTRHPVLSGWLHRTAQNIAAQTVRTDVRRRAREQEAVAMNDLLSDETTAPWENIAPHLDAALGELNEPDRDALLLRYFERKSARDMAQILSTTDEAAQKRVTRAVERLRDLLARRGIAVGAGGLALVISANAVHAAPASLGITISTATALAGKAVAGTTTATISKTIAMTVLQKIVITAAVVTIAAATGTYAVYYHRPRAQVAPLISSSGAHPPGTYISSAELVRAGYATPEAGLETFECSMVRGTYEQAHEALTPALANLPSGSKDERGDFLKRQPVMAPIFKGMQIVAKKVIADDQVELKVKIDVDVQAMKKLTPNVQPFTIQQMIKTDGEWKNGGGRQYDASWDASGKIQVYVP